jgi:hypothetical protein
MRLCSNTKIITTKNNRQLRNIPSEFDILLHASVDPPPQLIYLLMLAQLPIN